MKLRSYLKGVFLARVDPVRGFRRSLTAMMHVPLVRLRERRVRSWRIARRYGCYVAASAMVADDVVFPHPVGIVVGEGVAIETGCVIYQQVTLGRRSVGEARYPHVGPDCVLFAGAVIVGGVRLAAGTIVGANSVVTSSNNEPGATLAGIPARPMHPKSESGKES